MFKLVIVDDEDLIRENLVRCVAKHSQVQVAAAAQNGLEGLELIKRFHPDIVLTDVVMPGLDGIGMIERCVRQGCGARFIILSGHREFKFAQQALKFGVNDYILKPASPEDILEALNKVIERLEQRQEDWLSPVNDLSDAARYSRIVEDIFREIEMNLDDEALSLKWLCQTRLFVNETYAGRVFKKETNQKFSDYINERRIKKAVNLLKSDPSLPILSLAEQVGFGENYRYFIEIFKKYQGITPKQYQKKLQREG